MCLRAGKGKNQGDALSKSISASKLVSTGAIIAFILSPCFVLFSLTFVRLPSAINQLVLRLG